MRFLYTKKNGFRCCAKNKVLILSNEQRRMCWSTYRQPRVHSFRTVIATIIIYLRRQWVGATKLALSVPAGALPLLRGVKGSI